MSKVYGTIPTIATEHSQSGTVIAVLNKEGHSCCGGCCDMRRAVIVLDLVMIVTLLVDVVTLLLYSDETFEDDEMQQVAQRAHSGLWIFASGLESVLLGITISGAVDFSSSKVAVGLAVFGIGFIRSIVRFNLPSLIMTGLFAYPHYFLYQEINAGIMTKENYYNEEQSCCCV